MIELGVSVNPQKMVTIPFTRKRDLKSLKNQPSLDINYSLAPSSVTSDSSWTSDWHGTHC